MGESKTLTAEKERERESRGSRLSTIQRVQTPTGREREAKETRKTRENERERGARLLVTNHFLDDSWLLRYDRKSGC